MSLYPGGKGGRAYNGDFTVYFTVYDYFHINTHFMGINLIP